MGRRLIYQINYEPAPAAVQRIRCMQTWKWWQGLIRSRGEYRDRFGNVITLSAASSELSGIDGGIPPS
jgi:hypothetical protein